MIRSYRDSDYPQLKELYEHSEWYGGVFDEARDGRKRLKAMIKRDPGAILVYDYDGTIKGTISLIDDGRVAMLYRFVVPANKMKIARALYDAATACLKSRGHTQILVYSAANNVDLDKRYVSLGMHRGGTYLSYWVDI